MCVCNWIWHERENFEYTWNVEEILAWKLSLRWIKPPPPATKARGRRLKLKHYRLEASQQSITEGWTCTVSWVSWPVPGHSAKVLNAVLVLLCTPGLERLTEGRSRAKGRQSRQSWADGSVLTSPALCWISHSGGKGLRTLIHTAKGQESLLMTFSKENTRQMCVSVLGDVRKQVGNWIAEDLAKGQERKWQRLSQGCGINFTTAKAAQN